MPETTLTIGCDSRIVDKLKLATIVGTRPEIIKLAMTIKACDKYFDQTLIHTGQNYDFQLNEVFFNDFGLRKPDLFLESVGSDLGETIGNVIARTYSALSELKPDALLVLGDTNSALAAISAKRLKIPIFHMEAGNRCFDENLPEEINRKIVDHISDVNLPYSEHARRNLADEGLKAQFTFVTGSPMAELLEASSAQIAASNILQELGLAPDGYFLVSAHREENVDDEANLRSLIEALNSIVEKYDVPIVFSLHPRTRNRLEQLGMTLDARIRTLQPFGFFDYVRLQQDSFCVLSDSGTLAEESSILGFSGVSLRTSTERPEAVDKGSFVIGGVTTKDILQAIELTRSMKLDQEVRAEVPDYRDNNVSVKVAKIIQSYAKIIDRDVWRKTRG